LTSALQSGYSDKCYTWGVFDKCYTGGVFDKCYTGGVSDKCSTGQIFDKCYTGGYFKGKARTGKERKNDSQTLFGRFWKNLGTILPNLSPIYPILELSWELFEIFGPSWSYLGLIGTILSHLGVSWDQEVSRTPRPEITVAPARRFEGF
jgi:hypothetical protein